MAIVAFDTLKFAHGLKTAGILEQKAEAQATALDKVLSAAMHKTWRPRPVCANSKANSKRKWANSRMKCTRSKTD